jgi:hypothetical protein
MVFSTLDIHAERRPRFVVMSTILLILLILLVVGALPSWPYSSGWGYGPSGLLGVILIVMLVLLLMGRL